MKLKYIIISVGLLLLLSACGSNNVSSNNEFSGTWKALEVDHGCPADVIKFEGQDKMIWEGMSPDITVHTPEQVSNEEGKISVNELTYTRIFEDDFVIEEVMIITGKELKYASSGIDFLMKKDNDRLQIVFNKNQNYAKYCTYAKQ